jgi:hypothetical protein
MADEENLDGLVEEVRDISGPSQHLSVKDIIEHLGRRSFGPLLLLAALPTLTPISTIPGVATVCAIVILLTTGQMALGYERPWLPDWIMRRKLKRSHIDRASGWLRPVAHYVDKMIRSRLTWLVEPPSLILIATACALLTLVMFPLQLIPFTSGIPSFPVALFGLGIVARDGALAILGFVSTAVVLGGSAALLANLI